MKNLWQRVVRPCFMCFHAGLLQLNNISYVVIFIYTYRNQPQKKQTKRKERLRQDSSFNQRNSRCWVAYFVLHVGTLGDRHILYRIDYIHAADDFTENRVSCVELGSSLVNDVIAVIRDVNEEGTSCGVCSRVRHSYGAYVIVVVITYFVRNNRKVVLLGYAALNHKVRDNSVEGGSVVQAQLS